ncbi:3303_t:CDS:1 [Diversispora eburnea]|uniref:3303_t:CDS:1 n=1 Tax=Diversispora eburnea TaxID=1213867 RepID=A0A9N9CGN7_9GLOM|nr:3303_t:CDS:1 [Diversispora eburnea]
MASEKGQRLARAKYPTFNRNRLPTLQEVLSRKTAPPVCLFNFYLYMRDREYASEYLDFYLDVLEHEVICKAFVKDIKKLGLDVNLEYPEYEKFRPPEKGDLSRFSNDGVHRQLSGSSRGSDTTFTSGSGIIDPPSRPLSPLTVNSNSHVIDISSGSKGLQRNRDSVRSNKTNTTAGNLSFYDRERPFSRKDLRESAERIYYKYIYEGSEKLIKLPEYIRKNITLAIDGDPYYKDIRNRGDPWIYHDAKKEIYEKMENQHFPRFLQARAFGNMGAPQTMLRLVIGLFFLFLGFAIALSFIFLDIKPNTKRIWVFIFI